MTDREKYPFNRWIWNDAAKLSLGPKVPAATGDGARIRMIVRTQQQQRPFEPGQLLRAVLPFINRMRIEQRPSGSPESLPVPSLAFRPRSSPGPEPLLEEEQSPLPSPMHRTSLASPQSTPPEQRGFLDRRHRWTRAPPGNTRPPSQQPPSIEFWKWNRPSPPKTPPPGGWWPPSLTPPSSEFWPPPPYYSGNSTPPPGPSRLRWISPSPEPPWPIGLSDAIKSSHIWARKQQLMFRRTRPGRQLQPPGGNLITFSVDRPLPPEWVTTLKEHHYRIGRQLSAGGFGINYEVWKEEPPKRPDDADKPHDSIHAVAKFIQHHLTRLDFVETEIKICREYPHRFIARTIDVFHLKNVTILTHEFAVDDLQGLLSGTTRLANLPDRQKRAEWMAEMADALMYLHRNGVAHCDLKPNNVLMFDNHRAIGLIAKLNDFGLAVITPWRTHYESLQKQNLDREQISRTMKEIRQQPYIIHEARGTPIYMAPEGLRLALLLEQGGLTQYDPFKADIFSLAVTFHFVAFGELPGTPRPWIQTERLEHLDEIVHTEWRMVIRRLEQFGGYQFGQLMAAMFHMDPNLRPKPEDVIGSEFFSSVRSVLDTIPHVEPYRDLFQ